MSRATGDSAWAFETAEGAGGIAVISIAGARAFEVLSRAFRPARKEKGRLEAGRLVYGFIERDGEVLDEVVVAPFPEGNAFYRGPCAEVNCHGGAVASREVGRYLTELGATALDHEAFMERYCSLTLCQRHALRMLTRAGTQTAMRAAMEAFAGAGERRMGEIRALAGAEGASALGLIERTIREAERAEALFRPRRLAVVGPANVGKSSLVNVLLGEERLLVDAAPGTTRDTVEVSMALAGWPVTVFDTAGIREAGDEVESEGVERALEAARNADVVVVVLDARRPEIAVLERVKKLARGPVVAALNKMDLLEGGETPTVASGEVGVLTCALTGAGVRALGDAVLEKAHLAGGPEAGALLLEGGELEELRRMERALAERWDGEAR
ncbi:MAG: GTPase [Planctomycetota bacterium]